MRTSSNHRLEDAIRVVAMNIGGASPISGALTATERESMVEVLTMHTGEMCTGGVGRVRFKEGPPRLMFAQIQQLH